jgi:hypothetical protein
MSVRFKSVEFASIRETILVGVSFPTVWSIRISQADNPAIQFRLKGAEHFIPDDQEHSKVFVQIFWVEV